MESHFRTVLKTLTWRVTALAIITAVAWVITDEVKLAAEIGIADTLIKLFAYYGHERIWLKLSFGRQKPPDYAI